MINIKNFEPNLPKIDKMLQKNIDIYYIGYITMKDHVNIHNVNPLFFIIGKVDSYIEECNGNKHLTLVSTDKNKEVLIKYTELWNKIKNLIETINRKPGYNDGKYMKIKFNSDDNFQMISLII